MATWCMLLSKGIGVAMRVISKRPFIDACKVYPNQRQALDDLYKVLLNSQCQSPAEMRRVIPSLDNFKYKDKWWVIDVGGNHLRVIAYIQFVCSRVYVKHILTHADYDKLTKRYGKGELQ